MGVCRGAVGRLGLGMEVVVFSLFAVAAAIGALHSKLLSARARAKRALKNAPCISVSDAKDGQLVKLVGRLQFAGEPLSAPISGKPCAYFCTVAWGDEKRTAQESDFCRRFWIEDGSGRALVEMGYPTFVVSMDADFRVGYFKKATPRMAAFLERHHMGSHRFGLRCEEGVLEEGETVAVYGLCRREPDPDPRAPNDGYRGRPTRLCIVEPPLGEMLISDDPKVFAQ